MKRLLLSRQSYLVAVLLAIGLAIWMATGVRTTSAVTAPEAEADVGGRTVEALTPVRVREFNARPVQREIIVNGRTEPNRSVELRAETDGRVVELGAERGAHVEAGAFIARLDLRDRKARLAEAEAAVEQFRINYEAARKLREKDYMPETKLAEAKAQLEAARAAVARIRLDIAHTTIKAPFEGVLQERRVELGDFVDVGNVVARVVDTDPLLVVGDVNEQEVGFVSVGDSGTAELVTGETVEGRIRYVAAESDSATRTFRVELVVPNPDGKLRAGVTTEARLSTPTEHAHHLSPALLALGESGTVGVKAVDDSDRVRFHPVTIIRSDVDGVWVTGLPERVRLITVGQGFVRPGETVRPVPEASVGRKASAATARRDG